MSVSSAHFVASFWKRWSLQPACLCWSCSGDGAVAECHTPLKRQRDKRTCLLSVCLLGGVRHLFLRSWPTACTTVQRHDHWRIQGANPAMAPLSWFKGGLAPPLWLAEKDTNWEESKFFRLLRGRLLGFYNSPWIWVGWRHCKEDGNPVPVFLFVIRRFIRYFQTSNYCPRNTNRPFWWRHCFRQFMCYVAGLFKQNE